MDITDNNLESSSGEATINLMEYVYLFWQWLWLIILVAVIAGGVAYGLARNTIPTFQTTSKLIISQPPAIFNFDSVNSYSAALTLMNTYTQTFTDRPVLQGVIDKLELKMKPEELSGMIKVEAGRDSQVLTVTVTDQNPYRAMDIANTISQVFAERVLELQSQRYAATREDRKSVV